MRIRKRFIQSITFILLIYALSIARGLSSTPAERIRLRVDVAPALATEPLSGRLLIFMTSQAKPLETIEPDFLNPRAVFVTGLEVHNLTPGKPIEVDPDALSFPGPFSSAPAGDYQLMAQLDLNHSYTYNGTGPGDLLSEVKRISNLNPSSPQTIELTLTKRVPDQTVSDTESIKLVSFESPSLTKFWGRPIRMEAGVVLPPSYTKNTGRYPTVYMVHGYEGNHLDAWRRGPELVKEMSAGTLPEMIFVFLNASFPLGHHVFADSVNNGPWGHALTAEFIPHLEKQFRMDG
ncbi:MAG: enterochelin esterase, partial [Acidobacteriota bacterium]|nr:enterochelin esterase [Acidobacteriota bacterium]